MKSNSVILIFIIFCYSSVVMAGPFPPAAGQPGSTALPASSPAIQGWATGFENLIYGADVSASFQTPNLALGPSSPTNPVFDIVSLGNGGQITLTFDGALFDGAGADFAVFSNAFSDTFLELAFVEVSSDGVNFARFQNFSFTATPVSAFGSVSAMNIQGYASKYRAGFGTPFDLNELAGTPNLDINNIRYVRLIDILGNGTEVDSLPSQFGGPNIIYDPYRTTGSAGFDVEAVAALHLQSDPVTTVPIPFIWYWILFLSLVFLGRKLTP